MNWQDAQTWEANWWGDCLNTFYEEEKQLVYAEKMGIQRSPTAKTPYRFDLNGKSILDIGGGPVSLLLKCEGFSSAKVVDPLPIPQWVRLRYQLARILYDCRRGEEIDETGYDEVWLYNVLEHTDNPSKIIDNARRAGNLIRIFQWLDVPTCPGHPHCISEEQMNEWLGGEGRVEQLNESGCCGKAYYGVF